MAKKYQMDMCSGKLVPSIIRFTIPLVLTSLLQLLYNTADIIVVGRFVSDTALGAVGSTSTLITLIVNAFVGLSVGASVILAQSIGAKSYHKIHQIIHTVMATALLLGTCLALFGFLACKPLLQLMKVPDNVIDLATLYMKIYFLGMPGFMVFTFGSAIMRTTGDTKRPLLFLAISTFLNLILNLLAVLALHTGIAGVAVATIISQYVSAAFVLLSLIKSNNGDNLFIKELRIHGKTLLQMIKIGLPVAIQSFLFSFSNVIIQSSINTFGSDAMAGNAAAYTIENLIYVMMNAFGQSATTFVAQNYGAKNYKRVHTSFVWCLLFAVIIGGILGPLCYVFGSTLLKLYCPDNQMAIQFGLIRLKYTCVFYVACAFMEVLTGAIRGTGATLLPMLISVFGICGIRIGWTLAVFPLYNTLPSLLISFPISWATTALILACFYLYIKRKRLE